jgi:elongation factor Ts
MGISAQQVKELRDRTGAGMMDCKHALQETDGDMEAAVEHLEKKGIAAAQKKSSRVAAEGLVRAWTGEDESEAVIVEINCETDFVARNDQFQTFADEVTEAIGRSDAVSDDDLAEVDVHGKSVPDHITETIATLGENISVRRFARFSAPEGLVGTYIHAGGQIGVLVKVDISGDASRDDVGGFARDVAMHIAAMSPPYLTPDDIPDDVRASQEDVFAAQMAEEGKPEHIIPKIVTGKIKKWESEVSLLEQPFVKDTDKSVGEFQDSVGGVSIADFVRFEVGEGIEKQEADFREEVAEQLQG